MIGNRQNITSIGITLTMIPLISSCSELFQLSPIDVDQAILYVGNIVIHTATGKVIEEIFDNLFSNIPEQSASIPGYVIANSPDSLEGKYSTKLKLTARKNNQTIELQIDKPGMTRKKNNSPNWMLAPDLKQIITQISQKKFDEQVTISDPNKIIFCSIVPNFTNSLEGKCAGRIEIPIKDGGQEIKLIVDNPRMVRENQDTDKWDYAPDIKQVVKQLSQ